MGFPNWLSPIELDAAVSDLNVEAREWSARGRRHVVQTPGAADAPDPPLSDDLRRRQVALVVDYVTVVRAR
jgi:hypothetical protein